MSDKNTQVSIQSTNATVSKENDQLTQTVVEQVKAILEQVITASNAKIEISNTCDGQTTIKGSFDSSNGTERCSFTVEKTLYQNTISKTYSKKLSPQERMNAIEDMHNKGIKQKDIANILMCSQQTVSSDLKKINKQK